MSKNEEVCPEFPFWGASYPDACCVNGVLQDLDYCDENGNLYDKNDLTLLIVESSPEDEFALMVTSVSPDGL